MPKTRLLLYKEKDGRSPLFEWLDRLERREPTAYAKCVAKMRLLSEFGHELRRPAAAPVGDGIHELRIRAGRVNYRILYFHHGRQVVVLTLGLTKERRLAKADVERAVRARNRFRRDPGAHTLEL